LVDALAILKPVQASVIAFLCGATVGFVCNRMFVFKNSEAGFEALSKYFLLVGFSGVNNTLIMSLLIKGLAWNYLVAQLFATSCVFVINFAFCKFWIFKEPSYAK
jgi:putative flippase GtrA